MTDCLVAHSSVDTSYSFSMLNLRVITDVIQCVFCMSAAWKAQKRLETLVLSKNEDFEVVFGCFIAMRMMHR